MNKNKLVDAVATILLFIGFFFAFLPHLYHTKLGLREQTPHLKYVIYGMILVVVSLGILIYNNKALKKFK